jgi:hypothetical protein
VSRNGRDGWIEQGLLRSDDYEDAIEPKPVKGIFVAPR